MRQAIPPPPPTRLEEVTSSPIIKKDVHTNHFVHSFSMPMVPRKNNVFMKISRADRLVAENELDNSAASLPRKTNLRILSTAWRLSSVFYFYPFALALKKRIRHTNLSYPGVHKSQEQFTTTNIQSRFSTLHSLLRCHPESLRVTSNVLGYAFCCGELHVLELQFSGAGNST